MNGVDNAVTGAKQMWTGQYESTLLHQGVKSGSQALGANEQTAEGIATFADVSTILLGGTSGYKAFKTSFQVTREVTSFEKIALAGGEANAIAGKNMKSISGWKVVRSGGSKKAMEVYNDLLKAGYKSEKTTNGG